MPLPIIVREKINLKEQIVPSEYLTDEEIESLLNRWTNLLHQHRIHVVFNQTPVNIREQYDYLSTSFLHMELPPHPSELHFCFMYDRVEQTIPGDEIDQMIRQLIEDVFKKKETCNLPCLNRRLHFNEYENLSEPEFNYLVKSYAAKKPSISQCAISVLNKKFDREALIVEGKYQLGYIYVDRCDVQQGGWTVQLTVSEDKWVVKSLYIDGF